MTELYDYQDAAVNHGLRWVAEAKAGDRLLFASPTGTGKSYMELALLAKLHGWYLVSPKIEIITGLLNKLGVDTEGYTESGIVNLAAEKGIHTPIRLRSALLAGEIDAPAGLILDEAHHDSAESWQDLHLLCGYPPAIGFTATPYRGTPKSTAAFRAEWGEPVWVITFPEAVERGALTMPACSTVPLVDDDLIEVQNGELVAKQVNEAVAGRLAAVVELASRFFASGEWDRPTMFALPSRELCYQLELMLRSAGLYANMVIGDTPYYIRQHAFRHCLDRSAALIQVAVVSEGVDLPIRRLIDLAPSLSPVKWCQQFGRITRPGGESEYICCNRNLLRHGYLLDGCLPAASMAEAQAAFPPSSRSSGLRAVGLESLGRLKPVELPLKSGLKGLMYALSHMEGHRRIDYCILVHPLREEIVWTRKESVRKPNGQEMTWGKWHRCLPPADLQGFASLPPSPISEKQKGWWKRSAAFHGLDPDAEITRKQFPALPVLSDIRGRLS